jgi:hypothetical protein
VSNDLFRAFIARVRAGDQDAARELVERYEKVIRREVRMRLSDRSVLRVIDSMDISQSVLVSFFSRASSGGFEIETPDQLTRLLIGMTRNKLAFQVRRQHARRRDLRMNESTPVEDLEVAGGAPNPSEVASDRDLIAAIRRRLGSEASRLADLRAEGWEWSDIAERVGGSVHARRIQFARAVRRVARHLRLDGQADR